MAKHTVLLLGATGESGGDILDALVKDGSFVSDYTISQTNPKAVNDLAIIGRISSHSALLCQKARGQGAGSARLPYHPLRSL